MPETLVSNEIITSAKEDDIGKVDESNDTLNTEKNLDNNHADSEAAAVVTEPDYDLSKFRLERILNNNTRNKSIALLGNFPNLSESDNAIVIFEKQAFQVSDVATTPTSAQDESNGLEKNGHNSSLKKEVEEGPLANANVISEKQAFQDESNGMEKNGHNSPLKKEVEEGEGHLIKPTYFCSDLKVQTEFINNIYGSYKCTPPANLNDVKATVVYPATDKHVEKYSISQKYVIREYPELYKSVTLPYITSSQFSLEWVYNILEHKQETERIIFEDPDPETGFILLPDLKWNGRSIENLYVLAIVHKHDIKSLRDLNASHLPLLRNIRKMCAEAIEKHYGLVASQLRMYFHYQPSFYHLHIHINPVTNDAPGIWCEKSHMLDTVINNLELLPEYYERATLPCVLFEGNKLLELYEAKIPIRKLEKGLAEIAAEDEEFKAKKPKIKETPTNEIIESKTD